MKEEAVYPMVPAGSDLHADDPQARRGKCRGALVKHTLVAQVLDQPGVLNRVASLFRRRAFNIDSLTVGHSETPRGLAHDDRGRHRARAGRRWWPPTCAS